MISMKNVGEAMDNLEPLRVAKSENLDNPLGSRTDSNCRIFVKQTERARKTLLKFGFQKIGTPAPKRKKRCLYAKPSELHYQ